MKKHLIMMIILALISTLAKAATPSQVNYQGRLTNAGGTAVPDGSYSVVFTVYDAQSGGNSKWTETQSVTTSGGLFTVALGAIQTSLPKVGRRSSRR